jgi:tRNA threonylcarbamoyladenosine biosynthesis protein TsaE
MATHTTNSEAETIALGRAWARDFAPGTVILLEGPLGAGKTALARGIAEGLGCDTDPVSSPTFTIVQEYKGPVRMQHVDLYRLSPKEVDELGLDELGDGSVLVVEWPDRWLTAPSEAIRVQIEPMPADTRRIQRYSTR